MAIGRAVPSKAAPSAVLTSAPLVKPIVPMSDDTAPAAPGNGAIAAPKLGALVNRIRHSQDCAPWTFGVSALMRNLARRNLLRGKA